MTKKCEICGNEFEAKRDTARFCGAKCRKLAFLNHAPENAKSTKRQLAFLPGRDDIYSPDYDLSEVGFIRRNKNWMEYSEKWLARRRKDVKEYTYMLTEDLRKNLLIKETSPAL